MKKSKFQNSVWIWSHFCIKVTMHVYLRMNTHACMRMSVCRYICVNVHVCMSVYVCACMLYVRICICLCVCIYVCVYDQEDINY